MRKLALRSVVAGIVVACATFGSAGAVEPVAVLMSLSGPVEVHRPQAGVLPGAFGLHLGGGDEIVTGAEGAADVLFASGQSIHLGPKSRITIQGKPAASGGSDNSFESVQRFVQLREARGTSSLARLRSGGRPGTLRALAPTSGQVRSTTPLFRWTGGDPKAPMLLKVYDAEKLIWSGAATGLQLQYPKEAPALQSGVRYSWAIESDDPLQVPPLRSGAAYFECLTPEQAAQVEKELAAISGGEMSEQGEALAQASVLYGHGLLDEAIARTEQIVAAEKSADMVTILAQLYVEAGRVEDALIQMDQLAHPQ